MSAASAVYGIVARDLQRATRQSGRLVGGLARPFMWLVLIGTGYGAIARVEGGMPYQAYVVPGVVVMASLFGGMLTAISTVYDREFGMLRLMLASPAGVPALLAGRSLAAAAVGILQGGVVLAVAPLVSPVSAGQLGAAVVVLGVNSFASGVLGLLVASRLRSVENFAGVINVVLFPLLFASGALYPVAGLPRFLRALAAVNPVTYQVDLLRHALGRGPELPVGQDVAVIAGTTVVAFLLAALLFDPEQRFVGRRVKGD